MPFRSDCLIYSTGVLVVENKGLSVKKAKSGRLLGFHDGLESAVGHAGAVKGHGALLTELGHAGIGEDLGIDFVAVGAGFEDGVGEDDGLAGFGSGHGGKGDEAFLALQCLAGALAVLEGAVLAPDSGGLAGDGAVFFYFVLSDGEDESVDVFGHGGWFLWRWWVRVRY